MVNRRLVIISVVVIALLIVAVVALPMLFSKPAKQPATTASTKSTSTPTVPGDRSTTSNHTSATNEGIPPLDELTEVVEGFDNDAGGTYQVTSASQPKDGWLVAIVSYKNNFGTFIQYAILEQTSSGSYYLKNGPSTTFPYSLLVSQKIPTEVIAKVPTYNG